MIPRMVVAGLFVAIIPGVIRSQEGGRVTFETIMKSLETHKEMYYPGPEVSQ